MFGSDIFTFFMIFLLAGFFGATGRIIWRSTRKILLDKQYIQETHKQLTNSFLLSGYLLEAQNEEAAVLAAMRAGNDLLEALGCAFVPFSEWGQSVPVLKHGDLPFLDEPDWRERLSEPATRHACRNCKNKQAGAECILLQPPADAENVYCVALRCSGREIGVISYFFPEAPRISESQKRFLGEMVRLTDLALDTLRTHAHELDRLQHTHRSIASKKVLMTVNAEHKDLLEELEYQAVLDERTRLAREIHDGLAQTLAFLKIEATRMQTYVEKGETDSMSKTLQACRQTISDAYLDARQAIDNLHRIPDASLADWLNATATDFTTLTGLTVDASNINLKYAFPKSTKAQLIRIVQEALTNIRKHAQACTVSVSAFRLGDEAIIEVQDNGQGFTPEDVRPVSHYGLRSMRERAESIGADFQITSAPGMGTTVRLQIPILEKETS